MKFIKSILVSLLSVMLTLLSISSVAGPGHDHGDSAPQTLGSSSPRFVAESEDLELVGIVNGKKITLYLDRFQSNTPVKDAVIEIDIEADAKDFGLSEFDYYSMKTKNLLDFGVKEVFWFFSASKQVAIARPNQDWIIANWDKELVVLGEYKFSLEKLLEKEGFKL